MTSPSAPPRKRSPVAWQSALYGLDPERFFAGAQRRLGDVFTVRVLGETWTVVSNPSVVKEAFALGPMDANSGEANYELRPLIGTQSVLLLDGAPHLSRRKLLLPSFHGDRMRAYENTIRSAAERQIALLPCDRPTTLLPPMQELTFTVIMSCIFGMEKSERLTRLGTALRQMLSWITDMRRALLFAALGAERLIGLPSFRRMVKVVDKEIFAEIRRRRMAEDLETREDILSLLIQAKDAHGEGLADSELRDELVTLLVAGHETTATALAWAAVELARHPTTQLAIAEEDGSTMVDSVIRETLRLRPPVPVVLRRLRNDASLGDYDLPAGTTVAPCSLLVHRNPDIYPEPWAFQPQRFVDRRPPASEWFPFGGATRRCIGAAFAEFEARIVLKELLSHVQFEPAKRRKESLGRRGPVLVPGRGARVIVRDRSG